MNRIDGGLILCECCRRELRVAPDAAHDRRFRSAKAIHGKPTPREADVLQLLVSGLPYKSIANQLGIAQETVKWHAKMLFNKLGAMNRNHLVRRAQEMGILT